MLLVANVLASIFVNPLLAASVAGFAAACWLGHSWRLQTFPIFNGIVAVVVFGGCLMLGMVGAIAVADYHAFNGGDEPSFVVYWLPFGAMALLVQLALGAIRAGLAR